MNLSLSFEFLSAAIFDSNTGGSCLMRISLVRISLLRFFKTFHKYLPNAKFGLFISLVQLFCYLFHYLLQFALCQLILGYLFHYCEYLTNATFPQAQKALCSLKIVHHIVLRNPNLKFQIFRQNQCQLQGFDFHFTILG